jgi:hypothetical protein
VLNNVFVVCLVLIVVIVALGIWGIAALADDPAEDRTIPRRDY